MSNGTDRNGCAMRLGNDLLDFQPSEDEKEILAYLFGVGEEHRPPAVIMSEDRIWFDPCSGTGITPCTVLTFLRRKNEGRTVSIFEHSELFECRYHLELMPRKLFLKAMRIYNGREVKIDWAKEGF